VLTKKLRRMKKIRRYIGKTAAALGLIVGLSACEMFNLDLGNPNNPSSVTPDLLLPTVVLNASSTFAGGLNNSVHGVMGITTASDNFGMTTTTWNGTWNYLYQSPLKDLDELIKYCQANEGFNKYLGVAQVLKAYYFSTMVDLWGDLPYFEAFNGNAADAIKYAQFDDSQAIYTDLIAQLTEAATNLSATTGLNVAATADPIYGGSTAKWIRAANSLKLKLLLQTRLVNGSAAADIAAALSATGGLITSTADDFQFEFGRLLNPDNRHPWYQNAYSGASNGFSYFGHQFMVEQLRDLDPRLPFYLKRQTTKILDPNNITEKTAIPCSQVEGCTYAYLVLNPNIDELLDGNVPSQSVLAGYFGRDRSDPSGVPDDTALRTAPGVYPAGGLYDDVAEATRLNNGFGNGIFPMICAFNVKLYILEANLTLGVAIPATLAADARELFESALRQQIDKVEAFGRRLDAQAVAMDDDEVDDYVDLHLARYDAATTDESRLSVVLKQAWFMNFGNGYEIYNAFRRTGYPNNLQTPLVPVREFAYRFPYTQDELLLNPNAPATPPDIATSRVFWDPN
jgi:hypothetical protein